METRTIVDILGWIASVEIVLAFALNSFKKIEASSRAYQFLNASGALLLIVNTGYHGAYPSTALNVVWMFIALFALFFSNREKVKPSGK